MYSIKLDAGEATGYPILDTNLLEVFPGNLATIRETHGYAAFIKTERPSFSSFLEELIEGTVVENGVVVQTWTKAQKSFSSPEELQTAIEMDAKFRMSEIRKDRDFLLKDTDFFLLGDVTTPEGILEYRQALRDFPDVVDLENVIFPINPTKIEK